MLSSQISYNTITSFFKILGVSIYRQIIPFSIISTYLRLAFPRFIPVRNNCQRGIKIRIVLEYDPYLSNLVFYFSFMLLVIYSITKDNIWIIGKQPRSLEIFYLETLFVTNPMSHPPLPTHQVRSLGGPPVECFCYDIDFGFGS